MSCKCVCVDSSLCVCVCDEVPCVLVVHLTHLTSNHCNECVFFYIIVWVKCIEILQVCEYLKRHVLGVLQGWGC